jgi:hypothetical protein
VRKPKAAPATKSLKGEATSDSQPVFLCKLFGPIMHRVGIEATTQ